MPNHCHNDLEISGSGIGQLLDAIKSGGDAIDFNRILPMPEILVGTHAGDSVTYGLIVLERATPEQVAATLRRPWIIDVGVHSEKELKSLLLAEFPDCKAVAEHSLKAQEKTGFLDWYQWANAKWGTKWNAYETSIVEQQEERAIVRFATAWSPPLPLIQTLSHQWPNVQFVLNYEEFHGGFSGTLTLRGGKGRWVQYDLELEMTDDSNYTARPHATPRVDRVIGSGRGRGFRASSFDEF